MGGRRTPCRTCSSYIRACESACVQVSASVRVRSALQVQSACKYAVQPDGMLRGCGAVQYSAVRCGLQASLETGNGNGVWARGGELFGGEGQGPGLDPFLLPSSVRVITVPMRSNKGEEREKKKGQLSRSIGGLLTYLRSYCAFAYRRVRIGAGTTPNPLVLILVHDGRWNYTRGFILCSRVHYNGCREKRKKKYRIPIIAVFN